MDLISNAIPIFFLLIGVEVLVGRLRGVQYYRFNDAINDISCGILQQVVGVFAKFIIVGIYALIWDQYRL